MKAVRITVLCPDGKEHRFRSIREAVESFPEIKKLKPLKRSRFNRKYRLPSTECPHCGRTLAKE